MLMMRWFLTFFAAMMTLSTGANAQKNGAAAPVSALTYADLGDFATNAPITAELRIRKAKKLSGEAAINVLSTHQRFLIEADVTALIRGDAALPPRITYLYDAPRGADGKTPKLVKAGVIIFAATVPGRPTQVQLIARDAQISAIPVDQARVRTILADATAPDAPPRVTGAGNAFHVAGALNGEGETQIFLSSREGRPMSFNIVRTPDSRPSWSVSVGEIVDAAAPVPSRDSFLWYRLACFLPRTLPASSVIDATVQDAAIIAEDYRTVIAGLGACPRNRITRR
jgi:hypothetical protein